MRAVNARLDLSRVSVFHAVGTRRGVHRARGSLCASLRRHGVDLGNKLVGQRTDQLARHSRRELQARPRKKFSSECLSAQPRAFIRWRPQSGARLPPRRNRHSETRAPTSARGDPPEAPDADLDPVDECAPFSPDGNVATVIYSHIADVQTRGALRWRAGPGGTCRCCRRRCRGGSTWMVCQSRRSTASWTSTN